MLPFSGMAKVTMTNCELLSLWYHYMGTTRVSRSVAKGLLYYSYGGLDSQILAKSVSSDRFL